MNQSLFGSSGLDLCCCKCWAAWKWEVRKTDSRLNRKKDLSAIHVSSVAIHNTINKGLNSLKLNLSSPLQFLIDFTNSLRKSQNSLNSQALYISDLSKTL